MKPEQQRMADQRSVEMASDRQDVDPRCPRNEGGCGKKFGLVLTRPWTVQCSRCGSLLIDGHIVRLGPARRRQSG